MSRFKSSDPSISTLCDACRWGWSECTELAWLGTCHPQASFSSCLWHGWCGASCLCTPAISKGLLESVLGRTVYVYASARASQRTSPPARPAFKPSAANNASAWPRPSCELAAPDPRHDSGWNSCRTAAFIAVFKRQRARPGRTSHKASAVAIAARSFLLCPLPSMPRFTAHQDVETLCSSLLRLLHPAAAAAVFLAVFKWEARKGWKELVAGFTVAFKPSEPVVLWILARPFMQSGTVSDLRRACRLGCAGCCRQPRALSRVNGMRC